jgi:uncharacterized protein (TIGR03083 family)
MTSDEDRLRKYVDTWQRAVDDVVALLRSLAEDDWERPTDLPGWDVHAVAAHLAHLESELSGVSQPPVEVPELAHVKSPMGSYTEGGRIARRHRSPAAIIDELERAAAARLAELRASPPTDGRGDPPITPGGIGWDWQTLLRNRPLDVWMHEQDIRRAVDRPGGMDSPAAAHTVAVFASSFGFTVGKRVAPPAGTTVLLDVVGAQPTLMAVQVNDVGRAVPLASPPERPDAALRMDTEAFVLLAGGRRPRNEVAVTVSGEADLGERVLAAMAVTP